MSAIAELLFNLGADIQGSDIEESFYTKRLKRLGIPVFIGHSERHIQDSQVVIYF